MRLTYRKGTGISEETRIDIACAARQRVSREGMRCSKSGGSMGRKGEGWDGDVRECVTVSAKAWPIMARCSGVARSMSCANPASR